MRNGRATRAVEAAHDALPASGERLAAAAALGARRQRRCSSFKYSPVLPPHRANHARRGPRFSVVRLRSRDTLAAANFGETSPKPWRRRVAPCRQGGAPNAAAALGTPGRLARLGATPDSHHGLLRRQKVLPAGPSLHASGARLRQSLDNVAARLLKRRRS